MSEAGNFIILKAAFTDIIGWDYCFCADMNGASLNGKKVAKRDKSGNGYHLLWRGLTNDQAEQVLNLWQQFDK